MQRRDVLTGGLALAAGAALPALAARADATVSRVRPGQPGWPRADDWAELGRAVGGRLEPGARPDLADPAVRKLLTDPFYIASQPGLTQSSGWLDAWRSQPPAYVVAAQGPADVAAAVRFASTHNLRLVVRGGAHSYFGASSAPDSLMIWTRPMSAITVHDGFTPRGSSAAPIPAVSVGAGAIWLHAYQAVSVEGGRYVQGGGCTTVGVAGLVQGGGFGSFSKGFGTAAASLLEAEIVTADGQLRVVNASQDPDLFWALKGGGGGAFGVTTRLTLATHELPRTFGAVRLTIKAHSDEAFRRLLARFIDLYATRLFNPNWGEQARATPDNELVIEMVFQGLSREDGAAAFAPLVDFAKASPGDYDGQDNLVALAMPARGFWDAEIMRKLPGVITPDTRPGAGPNDFWWSGNTGEVSAFWNAYASAWLPSGLLKPERQARLVGAWFDASRRWGVAFHFNKGLAGAAPEAIAASRQTATNPAALDAFALAIIADLGPPPMGPSPDLSGPKARAAKVHAAMDALKACAPDAGAYVNECDYFQADWQTAFWGEHYPKLAEVKRRYDPAGLFYAHHTPGSEAWSADGFTRAG